MGTEDPGLGKLTPFTPDTFEYVRLQPEESRLLMNPSQYKHIAGIVTSQKNNIRNVIASVIEDIYDKKGNKIKLENSDGYWQKYEYDKNGNKIKKETSNGIKEEILIEGETS